MFGGGTSARPLRAGLNPQPTNLQSSAAHKISWLECCLTIAESQTAEVATGDFGDEVVMKLIETLNLVSKTPCSNQKPLKAGLACGFTPLRLQTLPHAELQQHFPGRRVEIKTSHYEDITGTLGGLRDSHLVEAVEHLLSFKATLLHLENRMPAAE